MEILLSYNVGLSTVNIVKNPGGEYQYVVNDVASEKYEEISRFVNKALETVDPRKKSGLYDIAKAIAAHSRNHDLELIAYVVSKELKYKKLQVLIDDPYVEDISIVGPGPVWVRHRYILEIDPLADYIETSIVIGTYEELMNYMELIAERSGKIVNRRTPIMNFTLPDEDGGHRVHLVLPDVAHSSGEIVIRKKTYYHSADLDSLVKAGMIPDSVAELIKLVIRGGGSIMILGPPGSGKTTLLKAILYSVIPRFWKIAIIEDTPEIDIPKGASWVRYIVPTDVWGSERGIDQMSLAKAALRASVSRFIVIGETRGAEAKVLAQAMNMGLGGLCLPRDQLVLARVDGIIDLYEIGEIVEGVLEGRYSIVEVVSIGPDLKPRWARASRVVMKNGSRRFVKVEVEGGSTHELHEEHIVPVAGDSGLTLKRASELKPGDILLSLMALPRLDHVKKGRVLGYLSELVDLLDTQRYRNSDASTDFLASLDDGPEGRHRVRPHSSQKLPLRLVQVERSLGYVLGILLASRGADPKPSRRSTGIRLIINRAKLPKLFEALENLGIPKCDVSVVGPDSTNNTFEDSVQVLISSLSLTQLLTRILGGDRARKMWEFPLGLALESSSDFRAGLIEGYWDVSGTISCSGNNVFAEAHATSKKVAESLALLLRTFGILTSVREAPPDTRKSIGGDHYVIRINREDDVKRFFKLIAWKKHIAQVGCAAPRIGNENTGVPEIATLRVVNVEIVEKNSLLYDIEVPESHVYAISGSLILTHNTTFHAGSPDEAVVRLTSPPIELTPQQLSMIWLFITLGFAKESGLKRTVIRVDEPVLEHDTLIINTLYRYGESIDFETLLKRFSRARELWVWH